MIRIERAKEVAVDRREIRRYLGVPNGGEEETIAPLLEECLAQFLACVQYQACYDDYPLERTPKGWSFANLTLSSASLDQVLRGCRSVRVFVATIGVEADRLLQRYSLLSPAHAVVAQAVGTACVEAFCDTLCEDWGKEYPLRPRFSPGYGDLPITLQRELFRLLDCPRQIGVSLTEHCMMVPSKSVSALVGIGEGDGCAVSGCTVCQKQDCEFRREV